MSAFGSNPYRPEEAKIETKQEEDEVELCAMIEANTTYKTYCGAELKRRRGMDQMRQENAAQEGTAF